MSALLEFAIDIQKPSKPKLKSGGVSLNAFDPVELKKGYEDLINRK